MTGPTGGGDAARTTALTAPMATLLERFRSGQRPALARAISVVEDERVGFEDFLHAVLAGGPRARRVGLTGPPGAGKSTLLAALANTYRGEGEEVGVVAVDPTSPFSGGALLGDRIRMNDLATDPGIFIRSMATRGSLGGLATTTREVIDLMDAFGFPRVLVETVGVGQTELEITGAADTVVVVLVPESGDGVQTMKAGLMEIADVFVVNKSDRPGADRLVTEVRTALHLREGEAMRNVPAHHGVDLSSAGRAKRAEVGAGHAAASSGPSGEKQGRKPRGRRTEGWEIPVLKTVAQSGEGVEALLGAVDRHRAYLESSGELDLRRRARAERRVREVVERELRRRTWSDPDVQERLAAGLAGIGRGEETPYSVARSIADALEPRGAPKGER
jgi:LAO/AO transport system kinase